MRGGVTDAGRTTEQTLKIELLSQWKLEAEFRNTCILGPKSASVHFHTKWRYIKVQIMVTKPQKFCFHPWPEAKQIYTHLWPKAKQSYVKYLQIQMV